VVTEGGGVEAPTGRIGVIENIWASGVKHEGNVQKENYLKLIRCDEIL
jgi:hypothetical protein